ncbi:uncharacterized protein METZ01_LOCUS303353 [marine metagenome]|uniref:Uncharacterized protein n=1 Tax=marine metagenome TaxID=408172 RepID=A0A382MNW3_9ZZZZ
MDFACGFNGKADLFLVIALNWQSLGLIAANATPSTVFDIA